MHESAFSLLFDTRREVAELMGECPMCGAITILPVEVAWRQGVVFCCECGTEMGVTRGILERLREQADGPAQRSIGCWTAPRRITRGSWARSAESSS